MIKLILATILLVALNAGPSFSTHDDMESEPESIWGGYNANEIRYWNCFKEHVTQLSKVEIPPEVLKAQDYFYALENFRRVSAEREAYLAALSEQEEKDLISAATKFVSETKPIIYGGQCKGSFNYLNYVRFQTKESARKIYFDVSNAMILADWIIYKP